MFLFALGRLSFLPTSCLSHSLVLNVCNLVSLCLSLSLYFSLSFSLCFSLSLPLLLSSTQTHTMSVNLSLFHIYLSISPTSFSHSCRHPYYLRNLSLSGSPHLHVSLSFFSQFFFAFTLVVIHLLYLYISVSHFYFNVSSSFFSHSPYFSSQFFFL